MADEDKGWNWDERPAAVGAVFCTSKVMSQPAPRASSADITPPMMMMMMMICLLLTSLILFGNLNSSHAMHSSMHR